MSTSEDGDGSDLRKSVRVPYSGHVTVNGQILVKAIDLSQDGVYLFTGRSFRPGSVVALSFQIGDEKLVIPARVRHNREGVGIGLKFLEVPAREKILLENYITAHLERPDGKPHKKTVVIFTDQDDAARIIQSVMVRGGYAASVAGKPGEAMHLLQRKEGASAFIVALDLENPAKSNVVESLLRQAAARNIVAVVISPNTQPQTRNRALAMGAREFLPKNTTSPKKILDTVTKLS